MQSFDQYKGILPYASEIFGIYQPLLGWKSRITLQRFERGRAQFHERLAEKFLGAAKAPVRLTVLERSTDRLAALDRVFEVEHFEPVETVKALAPAIAPAIDSGLARMIAAELPAEPPRDWTQIVNRDRVTRLMERFRATVGDADKLRQDEVLSNYVEAFEAAAPKERTANVLEALFDIESKVAGYLLHLADTDGNALTPLFYTASKSVSIAAAQLEDPLLSFGANNYDAILSPIGVIHLYRNTSSSSIPSWGPRSSMSGSRPGGTVELIEISTRHTLTERAFEQSVETITQLGERDHHADDIADAVKEDNRSNVKFGFTATASYSAAVYSASATRGLVDRKFEGDRARDDPQADARAKRETVERDQAQLQDVIQDHYRGHRHDEQALRHLEHDPKARQLRAAQKDAQGRRPGPGYRRRFMLAHLCRRCRQGPRHFAKLVHIGKPPELGDLPQPDAPQIPTSQPQEVAITIPFVGLDTDDTDNEYTDGRETVDSGALDELRAYPAQLPAKRAVYARRVSLWLRSISSRRAWTRNCRCSNLRVGRRIERGYLHRSTSTT